jgi:hypothetical protein
MLAQYLDLADQFNVQEGFVIIDVSNYDYCLIQPIGSNVNIYSTIDSGAIQGVSDGSAVSATNFVPVAALSVIDGTTYSAGITDGEIGKLSVIGRYVKISKSATIDKLLIMLAKIS